MKKLHIISCIVTFLFTFSSLRAQENDESKTLINNFSANNLGFFFAPSLGLTALDGGPAALFQMRGGLTFHDKFSVGAYYFTSMNEIKPVSETISNVYMDYWSTGGFFEYTLMAKKVAHLSFPVYIGIGEVQMDNEIGEAGLGEANFFQMEPSALLEINLHKNVRINLGAGYRLVNTMTYRNFNQSDISGLTGYAGLKIGLFK